MTPELGDDEKKVLAIRYTKKPKRSSLKPRVASTTYLQRKLKIGYARAASLMDELEMRGVISSQEGSKPRRVLIDNPNQGSNAGE